MLQPLKSSCKTKADKNCQAVSIFQEHGNNTIDDRSHFTDIKFFERILGCVIVFVSEKCSIRDHDRPNVFIPIIEVIRKIHTLYT